MIYYVLHANYLCKMKIISLSKWFLPFLSFTSFYFIINWDALIFKKKKKHISNSRRITLTSPSSSLSNGHPATTPPNPHLSTFLNHTVSLSATSSSPSPPLYYPQPPPIDPSPPRKFLPSPQYTITHTLSFFSLPCNAMTTPHPSTLHIPWEVVNFLIN